MKSNEHDAVSSLLCCSSDCDVLGVHACSKARVAKWWCRIVVVCTFYILFPVCNEHRRAPARFPTVQQPLYEHEYRQLCVQSATWPPTRVGGIRAPTFQVWSTLSAMMLQHCLH